ncbi:MAG: esterase-like activity of phytase family protein [Vicinamibacterales bacterium]|nr:esterase-like activity of phytase family protein [Vicinamibacterales bacterium]
MERTWIAGAWLRAAVVVGSIGAVAAAPQSSPVAVAPTDSRPISIDVVPVPLNPQNPSEMAIGDFLYAGGLVLTSRQTDQLHGLSDLEVTGTDRVTAVGDLGILVDARLVLDSVGRLVGVADARLTQLTGEDGKPLSDKTDADAEGLALFANGDRLVSFERRDRIWLYPAAGGPPRPVPMPGASFPPNVGMEALSADLEAGADAYVVGAELSGDTWTCRLLSTPCIKGPTVDKPAEFGLVALKRLPGMRTAYLLRAFDPVRGLRISLQIFRSSTMVARMDLAPPATVDNFEGLAAVPQADGGVRFYLISDDNASATQRTLLLAFDWRSQ